MVKPTVVQSLHNVDHDDHVRLKVSLENQKQFVHHLLQHTDFGFRDINPTAVVCRNFTVHLNFSFRPPIGIAMTIVHA